MKGNNYEHVWDVLCSVYAADATAASNATERHDFGGFSRVGRERFLAADLRAAFGASLLDQLRALSLLIAFALLEGHVIGSVRRYAERAFGGLLWPLRGRGGLDRIVVGRGSSNHTTHGTITSWIRDEGLVSRGSSRGSHGGGGNVRLGWVRDKWRRRRR